MILMYGEFLMYTDDVVKGQRTSDPSGVTHSLCRPMDDLCRLYVDMFVVVNAAVK